MARKSPARTFSKTLAAQLTPSLKSTKKSSLDITYEKIDWHQTSGAAFASFQKTH